MLPEGFDGVDSSDDGDIGNGGAVWRATVVELLEGVLRSQQATERGLAALAAVLVARRPGGSVASPVPYGQPSSIRRTMDGGVADRARALLEQHDLARWQRLQLPILRTIRCMGGRASRTEVVRALKCNPTHMTRAVMALEAEGFLEVVLGKSSAKRATEHYELTRLAAILEALGADVPDEADMDAGLVERGVERLVE